MPYRDLHDLRQAHQREAALAALLVAATIGLEVTVLLAMAGMLLLHTRMQKRQYW